MTIPKYLSSNRSAFAALAIVSILAPCVLSGCGGDEVEGSKISIDRDAVFGPRAVVAVKAARRDFNRTFQLTGSLMAKQQARLRSLAAGPIEEITVDVGDTVAKGRLLVRTRPNDALLAKRIAQAALETALANWIGLKAWRRDEDVAILRARVQEKGAEADRLRLEAERVHTLFKRKGLSESEWDKARVEAIQAKAQVEEAKQQLLIADTGASLAESNVIGTQVTQARALLAQADQALEDTTLEAPFAGVITGKYRRVGDYANRGDELLELTALGVLEAEFTIPERFAYIIRNGLPVSIHIGSARITREGEVTAVNEIIDQRTRTFLIKVDVDNHDRAIKAGAFCTGELDLPDLVGAVSVPRSAVVHEEGRWFLWMAEDGKARRVPVQIGEHDTEFVEIVRGANEGDAVIVQGAGVLSEGDDLRVSFR